MHEMLQWKQDAAEYHEAVWQKRAYNKENREESQGKKQDAINRCLLWCQHGC